MYKKLVCLALVFCLFVVCTGCSGNTFEAHILFVETGDSVKITMDTSDNYALSSDIPFTVSQDGKALSKGAFLVGETYEEYATIVKDDENAVMLDSGAVDGMEYIFWSYNDVEFNYAILLEGGKTAIILKNNISEECAKECFARLSFSVDDNT